MFKYKYYDMPKIAKMYLNIYERLAQLINNPNESFEMTSFNQIWCNTSGGHEGVGGSAMTSQLTVVLWNEKRAFIFFDGNYGYKLNFSLISLANKELFFKDLHDKKIAGVISQKKKYHQ